MRIVITGGSGGVGRAATRAAVDAGHTVLSLDRVEPKPEAIVPGVEYRVFDLTDYDGLVAALTGADALIHLAAIPNPRTFPDHVTHNNNVVTSYNALRGAVDAGIKHICQASSINAIGGAYSREARYDYLPVDEQHPTYAEDPYSLSKWICEQQADSIARRYEDMTIGSLRFHWVVPDADLPRRLQAQIGRPVAEAAKAAAERSMELATPITDVRASDRYRRHTVGVMARRAVEAAARRAAGETIAIPVNRAVGIGAAS